MDILSFARNFTLSFLSDRAGINFTIDQALFIEIFNVITLIDFISCPCIDQVSKLFKDTILAPLLYKTNWIIIFYRNIFTTKTFMVEFLLKIFNEIFSLIRHTYSCQVLAVTKLWNIKQKTKYVPFLNSFTNMCMWNVIGSKFEQHSKRDDSLNRLYF